MTKTILVADDSRTEIQQVSKLLAGHFNVESFFDGMRAFLRIKQGGIDGCILDWEMKVCNSVELPLSAEERNEMFHFPEKFYGDKIAMRLREDGYKQPIAIRSSIADRLAPRLASYNVVCFDKEDDQDIKLLAYFQQQLK